MDQKTFQDYSSLIGIPYENSDCLGLAKIFYRKILNIDLLLWFDYQNKLDGLNSKHWAIESEKMVNENKRFFKKTTQPEFGDLILINLFGHAAHIGIFLNSKEMLHTNKQIGSHVDRINKWEKSIRGFYKYVEN